MKNIWIIMKRELDKVFGNKRTLFSTIILPGLLIFGIYSLMGYVSKASEEKVKDDTKTIVIVNPAEDIRTLEDSIFKENNVIAKYIDNDYDIKSLIQDVKSGKTNGLVVFEENFEEKVLEFKNDNSSLKPNVDLYFDTTSNLSNICFTLYSQILQAYQIKLQNGVTQYFSQNLKKDEIVDPQKEAGLGLSMLIPMIIITFVFAGAMGLSSDSVAGEKERGTIATLFMTPVEKKDIILGKILSTTIITLCSSFMSFLGIIASLPLAGNMFGGVDVSYGFLDYMSLLLLILSVSLIAVSILMLLSTIAKNTKEAALFSTPVYLLAMITSMLSMNLDGMPKELYYYFVPVFNVALGIKGVFLNSLPLYLLLLIILVNLLVALFITFILTKLFSKERIMYAK